jgi:ABC-type sulfate/molybdate transport systems ATPase subunit
LRSRASSPLPWLGAKRLGGFALEISHRSYAPRLALLGASGAGKTLTLRLLAGLTSSDPPGEVRAGGRSLDALPPERRGIGYVPQEPSLLPRRTVWRQVTFGAHARPALAAWWIERLGLAGLEERYPEELSGGQQRRVALARALAIAPEVLLLDEPFPGLDAPVRDSLRRELRRLQRDANLSTVIVTHDPEEAALLADEIVVLADGHVLQAGPRESVFAAPRSPEIAGLLGIANAHRGAVVRPGLLRTHDTDIWAPTGDLAPGAEVVWSVRAERISMPSSGRYSAVLVDDVDLGAVRELTVALGGALELTVRTNDDRDLRTGQTLRLDLPHSDIAVWPREETPLSA